MGTNLILVRGEKGFNIKHGNAELENELLLCVLSNVMESPWAIINLSNTRTDDFRSLSYGKIP